MALMRASIKGRYANDESSTACTFDFNGGGDVKLRASLTDVTFVAGPSFHGLSIAVEKPGSFVVGYDFSRKDVKFQFMNTIRVSDKPLNLIYSHSKGENKTALDGTLFIDSANKLSANYVFGSRNCKIKYSYMLGDKTTIEPCYDLGKNSWDFAVSHQIYDRDVINATYQTSSRVLGLDWFRFSNSKSGGGFKISATLNLADEVKLPKLTADTTWNFDL